MGYFTYQWVQIHVTMPPSYQKISILLSATSKYVPYCSRMTSLSNALVIVINRGVV